MAIFSCLLRECGIEKSVMVDLYKIKAVKNWVYPRSVIEVTIFMNLASYYRKLVKSFDFDCYSSDKVDREGGTFSMV